MALTADSHLIRAYVSIRALLRKSAQNLTRTFASKPLRSRSHSPHETRRLCLRITLIVSSYVIAIVGGATLVTFLASDPTPFCFSVVQGQVSGRPQIFAASGIGQSDAVSRSLGLCGYNRGGNCNETSRACYTPEPFSIDVQKLIANVIDLTKRWWTNSVTAFDIVAMSAILMLTGAVFFLLQKLRRQEQLLVMSGPPGVAGGVSGDSDMQAIKNALKHRQQKFEI
jgi:hypothetical protein